MKNKKIKKRKTHICKVSWSALQCQQMFLVCHPGNWNTCMMINSIGNLMVKLLIYCWAYGWCIVLIVKLDACLYHAQSPLICSRPALQGNFPVRFCLCLSVDAQGDPSCLAVGYSPLRRHSILQQKIWSIPSRVCLPEQPHLQHTSFSTAPNNSLFFIFKY